MIMFGIGCIAAGVLSAMLAVAVSRWYSAMILSIMLAVVWWIAAYVVLDNAL